MTKIKDLVELAPEDLWEKEFTEESGFELLATYTSKMKAQNEKLLDIAHATLHIDEAPASRLEQITEQLGTNLVNVARELVLLGDSYGKVIKAISKLGEDELEKEPTQAVVDSIK